MPRGRWFGRGFGWALWGWPGNLYPFCWRFPWLPRGWWSGMPGLNPLTIPYYRYYYFPYGRYWRW